jgi:hypothetical protein
MNNNNNKLSIFKSDWISIKSNDAAGKSIIAYNIEDVMKDELYIVSYSRHPLITKTVKHNYNINCYQSTYISSISYIKNIVEFSYSDLIIEFNRIVEFIDQTRYSEQFKVKPLKDLLEQIMINWN